jgi:hypothetical protein
VEFLFSIGLVYCFWYYYYIRDTMHAFEDIPKEKFLISKLIEMSDKS